MLTIHQHRALIFIVRRIDATGGVSPSLDEIAKHLGLKSKSGVARILDGLEERRFIARDRGRARNIRILKRPPAPNPPVFDLALNALVDFIREAPIADRPAMVAHALAELKLEKVMT